MLEALGKPHLTRRSSRPGSPQRRARPHCRPRRARPLQKHRRRRTGRCGPVGADVRAFGVPRPPAPRHLDARDTRALSPRPLPRWLPACVLDRERYDRFTRVYGEEAVREALSRAESAPRTASARSPRIINPEAFGLDGYVLLCRSTCSRTSARTPRATPVRSSAGGSRKRTGSRLRRPTVSPPRMTRSSRSTARRPCWRQPSRSARWRQERRALGPAALANRLRPPEPNTPGYLAWADAPEGTTATYLKTEIVNWIPRCLNKETIAVRFVGLDAEGAHLRVTTTRLNANGEAEAPKQSERTIEPWVQNRSRGTSR